MGLASLSEDTQAFPLHSMSLLQKLVRAEAALLCAILLIAAGFRFATIGGKSFWFDEAYSAVIAAHSPRDLLIRIQSEDTHPPLYYLLLSGWGRVVGTGDVELRTLGAIFSLFTVAGTWWLGRRLGSPTVGAVAAFIVAISPFEVMAAQEARMYPLLGFLSLLSWAALLAGCENRRGGWPVYVIATTLALYTHYLAMMLILAQGVYIFVAAPSSRWKWAGSLLATGVLFAPWVSTFVATWGSGRGWPSFRPPFGVAQLVQLFGMIGFGGYSSGFGGAFWGPSQALRDVIIALPFWIFAVIGGVHLRDHRRVLVFLSAYLLVPIVIAGLFSLRHNIFYPRYFSYVHPAFALLAAFGIATTVMRLRAQVQRTAVLAAALLMVSVTGLALQTAYADPQYSPYNWRGVAATLSAEAGPTDLIVVTPDFGMIPFGRYFRGTQRVIAMAPIELVDETRLQQQNRAPVRPTRPQFTEYARDHELLWLIITIPFPRTAFPRLEGMIKGVYDLQEVGDFTGITVYKLKRHRP